jgi:hypothetical protein
MLKIGSKLNGMLMEYNQVCWMSNRY